MSLPSQSHKQLGANFTPITYLSSEGRIAPPTRDNYTPTISYCSNPLLFHVELLCTGMSHPQYMVTSQAPFNVF